MINLEIPKYNLSKNRIEFSSVYLDYTNTKTKFENDNFCYGFKEIDAAFKNSSIKNIKIQDFSYFINNLKYFKKIVLIISNY